MLIKRRPTQFGGFVENIYRHEHVMIIIYLLYDWRESCLLIGPICLHKSLCLPGNWSKPVHKLILHENRLELVSRSYNFWHFCNINLWRAKNSMMSVKLACAAWNWHELLFHLPEGKLKTFMNFTTVLFSFVCLFIFVWIKKL